jgi:hypothetical protein
VFLPHTIKKVKLKLSQLNRNTETTFSTEKAKRRKKPAKNEAFFRHIRKQTFPTVSNIENRGKTRKQFYQLILSPGLIIGHTQRKFPASKGSHLPLQRIS